jgi:hypothetical protein
VNPAKGVLKGVGARAVTRTVAARKLRSLVGRFLPRLLTLIVAPTACFLLGRAWWGLAGGIGLGLAWNLGFQLVRWARGQAFSAVLLLGLTGLVARSSLALTFHSARMYFLVPSVLTAATAVAYIASSFTAKPLGARIVGEFLGEQVLAGSTTGRADFLRKGTLFYGVEQLISAATSIVLVLRLPTTAYATVHPPVSWLVLGTCMVLAMPLFRTEVALLRGVAATRRLAPSH